MPSQDDSWAAGATYEGFMGRWSRALSSRFLDWLDAPDDLHWLDVGCGTGALTTAIVERCQPASVLGCDPAEPLLSYARESSSSPRVEFQAAGAGILPKRLGGYGSITSMLAFNFFPDANAAIDEQRSLASPGGMISACVWDYAEGMQFLRYFWDVASQVDSKAAELDEGVRFPLCSPTALTTLFKGVGVRNVVCESVEIPTEFASFDDYWAPFLGGTGPAPSFVSGLSMERRELLVSGLKSSLPARKDGSIPLTARAWAIKAIVP